MPGGYPPVRAVNAGPLVTAVTSGRHLLSAPVAGGRTMSPRLERTGRTRRSTGAQEHPDHRGERRAGRADGPRLRRPWPQPRTLRAAPRPADGVAGRVAGRP